METTHDNHPPHGELRQEADAAFRKEDYREAIRLYTAALDCLKRDAPWDNEIPLAQGAFRCLSRRLKTD